MVVSAVFCLLVSLSDSLKSLTWGPQLSACSYPGIRESPSCPELGAIKERQLCAETKRAQSWRQAWCENPCLPQPSSAAPGLSLPAPLSPSFSIWNVATTGPPYKADAVS